MALMRNSQKIKCQRVIKSVFIHLSIMVLGISHSELSYSPRQITLNGLFIARYEDRKKEETVGSGYI